MEIRKRERGESEWYIKIGIEREEREGGRRGG